VLAYKVVTADTQGALFVAEQMMHARGGTPLHMHLSQDEWFYVLEGEFLVEMAGYATCLRRETRYWGRAKCPIAGCSPVQAPGRSLCRLHRRDRWSLSLNW
jgi:hypothetical protein